MTRSTLLPCLLPAIVAGLVTGLAACGSSSPVSAPQLAAGPTPQGECGPGSRPETGIQGRVAQADHDEGRAAAGFTCNTELVGSYTTPNPLGTVGGFKVERFVDRTGRECAYYDTTLLFPLNVLSAEVGVNVMDMSDPANPLLARRLISPAMLSPHESLVVSQQGAVLAAVAGNPALLPGIVDVYDLADDCRNPRLRSSNLSGVFGHESGMSPDGRTFWSASPSTPTLTAVDISLPQARRLWTGPYTSHGLSISADGNRAYASSGDGAGVLILDVSEIQARRDNPEVREISRISWTNQTIPQNAMPFTRNGRRYLLEIDEFSSNREGAPLPASHGDKVGAGRIIDIEDETRPFIVSNLRLAVHEPENRAAIINDPGARNLTGGYAGHYCALSSTVDPDIAACSMIVSGLRIFDIRDPRKPREIAYFNAPVQPRLLPLPAQASNWPMSRPAIIPARREIWYTDGYSGFYVVRVTNGVW